MEPGTKELFTAGAGVLAAIGTALGGSKGVVALTRHVIDLRRKRAARFADNEKFKTEVRTGLTRLDSHIQRVDAKVRSQLHLDARPIFEACDEGQVLWANRAFMRELGFGFDELMGEGWINVIAADDQARIEKAWRAAVRARRQFIEDAKVKNRDGKVVALAHIEAEPMRCTENAAFGWQCVFNLEKVA